MFSLERHKQNPILAPNPKLDWEREGVFNPGVAEKDGEVVMLYRAVGETEAYVSHFGLAKSKDGVNFTRVSDMPVFGPSKMFDQWATEDPRITQIGEDYYVTYVAVADQILLNGVPFPRTTPLETATALLKTNDFANFENLGVISPPFSDNKDIVLFPKKIDGRYAMLHRPNRWNRTWCDHLRAIGKSDEWPCNLDVLPQTPGIWYATSLDLKTWEGHKMFLHSSHDRDCKIGPGLPPLETSDGWLVLYQHVTLTDKKDCLVYSVRAALFDLNDPGKLIGKLPYDILRPEMPYEKEKDSQIVFPTGGFIKEDVLYVYYGASDRYICLATGKLSLLLSEIKKNASQL